MQMSTGIKDEASRQNKVLDNIKSSMGGADDMLRASSTKFQKVSNSRADCVVCELAM